MRTDAHAFHNPTQGTLIYAYKYKENCNFTGYRDHINKK